MTPLPCPGGSDWRTANLAKRHAWWTGTDPTQRQVSVQCETCGAWHLVAPPPAP